MKTRITLLILFILLLFGCNESEITSSNIDVPEQTQHSDIKLGNNKSSGMNSWPDVITLTFHSLDMEKLNEGEATSDWEFIGTVPFGEIENSKPVLEIYDTAITSDSSMNMLNGILKFNNKQYPIIGISSNLNENKTNTCPEICLFEQSFTKQEQYSIIGAIDISSNGPGYKKYLIYDKSASDLLYVDLWGEPKFIDLDADGNYEFIIQFEGLHLSFPDLSIIRLNNGNLEISYSVFDSIYRNQGDFAQVKSEGTDHPTISISNVSSEHDESNYRYNQGKLEKQ